jgi:hypothetical protein
MGRILIHSGAKGWTRVRGAGGFRGENAMMPLALVAAFALAAANEADGGEPAPQVELTQPADPLPEVEPAMQAPAGPGPELWEGEHRRVHFGLGIRVHGGLMASAGYPLWMLQSELLVMLSIRLRGHDELRIQISYGTGYPDLLGGESNVSFHHSFSRRVSLGVGVFAYLSVWSMRLGVEAARDRAEGALGNLQQPADSAVDARVAALRDRGRPGGGIRVSVLSDGVDQ